MPPSPEQALGALASQAFVTAPPTPGNEYVFTAVIEGLDKATITEAVLQEQVQNVPVDLSVLLKHVRFTDTPLSDPSTIGGMPVAEALGTTLSQVTHSPIPPPGVPGVLAALTGTIPVTVEALVESDLEVRANVRWHIREEDGDLASDVFWTLGAGGPGAEGSGGAVAPPGDKSLEPLRLAFVVVEELTAGSATSLTVRRLIGASLQLVAGGFSSDWIELPDVPVEIPTIRLPTILAMFQAKQLGESVFIAVPENSALDIPQSAISNAVQTLSDTLAKVQDVIDVAGFVTGLGDLKAGIDSAPKFRIEFDDGIGNFEDYILTDNWGPWNETWDNTMSSLVFLGPQGRRVEAFNAPSHHTNEGVFEMTITGLMGLVEIKDLHVAAPVPDIVHDASFRVTENPPGDRQWPRRNVYTFGNEMSGIKFG